MRQSTDRIWRIAKWAAVAVILVMVIYAFAKALGRLDEYELHWEPRWLAASGAFYLAGLFSSALYWWWLLRSLRQPVSFAQALRAYYIGHLGKYVPGKAMVIIMRTSMLAATGRLASRSPPDEPPLARGVRPGVVALTVAYEGLTTMGSGAIVAIALMGFTLTNPGEYALGVLVLLPAILLTVPAIFNPLVNRVASRFRKADAEPLPPFRTTNLLVGLGLCALGWIVQGASLWAAVAAVSENAFGPVKLAEYTTYLSIASVVGFYTPAPAGLGAREGVLLWLLTPVIGQAPGGLAALLLRLTWMVSEVAISIVLYPLAWFQRR